MTDKHFNAILAKNAIARLIGRYWDSKNEDGSHEPLYLFHILGELKTIEAYIGQGNQPSVQDAYETGI